jgi:hypothetical protein
MEQEMKNEEDSNRRLDCFHLTISRSSAQTKTRQVLCDSLHSIPDTASLRDLYKESRQTLHEQLLSVLRLPCKSADPKRAEPNGTFQISNPICL